MSGKRGWPKGKTRIEVMGPDRAREANLKMSRSGKKAWKTRSREVPEEARKKTSETLKRRFATDLKHPMLGHKHSEKTKRHWSEMRKGIRPSQETLDKAIAAFRKYWSNPDNRIKASKQKKEWFSKNGLGYKFRARAVRVFYLQNPVPEEEVIRNCLNKRRIKNESQVIFDRFCVDIFLPKFNAVIECDHSAFESLVRKKRDRVILKSANKIVHLSYKEIRANPTQATRRALQCLGII